MQPVLDRLDDYLLAAREAGAANADAVARRRGLDPELLRRWVTHLASAARDANDPLHAWARVASDATSARAGRVAEALRPLVEGWRRREADADTALTGTEVVIDYGAPSREGWIQDGFAFGPGPVRPGEVRLGTDPARPIARVFTRAAAEKDPAWDGLKLAPGTETDPGSLGKVVRSGRTLRTPTFEVRAGKVFSLVRGTGQIFAAVDHHVMIAGPLHGRVLQTVQTGPAFQWVEHDLTRYRGRRVHLEFTPIGTADFAVALVVQGERTPGSSERPSGALLSLLASDSVMSLEALAAGYQKLLARVAERFGADRLVGSADAVEQARLADWLVRHQELFLAGGAGKTVAAAAGPVLAEQARLVGRIRTESRLALALLDGSGVNEHVYLRGSYKTPGEVVPRRFLEALAGPEPLRTTRGSGRLELARQLTDPTRNPLVARVIVNRVWHHLFGRGIVASVDNFGVLGEPPTHPGLLDRLADTFVRDGWSLKRLVRRIVLSRAYRMASRGDERAAQADPQNLLLHRQNVRRLEGETIRDAMLAVSGRLDRRPFGPPVPVHLTDFQQGRGRPQSGPLDGAGRRSLYLSVRRNFLPALLLAFDTPAPFSTVGRRTVSNVPAQAWILLNDPFVHQQAGLWARRVLAAPGTSADRVERMYLSAFGRPPDAEELRACLEFLDRQPQSIGAARNEQAAWADLAHVLFNAKEFIYLP
ncbi:MAG: DUF1553 domain-containing protein [Gemmataceae bacterium]|nr:DUF1553 domain-containing protein [Gemmataceae bacterium]